jgi:hypothetical protein
MKPAVAGGFFSGSECPVGDARKAAPGRPRKDQTEGLTRARGVGAG